MFHKNLSFDFKTLNSTNKDVKHYNILITPHPQKTKMCLTSYLLLKIRFNEQDKLKLHIFSIHYNGFFLLNYFVIDGKPF